VDGRYPERVEDQMTNRPRDVATWLATDPDLHELRSAFPQEWKTVQAQIHALVTAGDVEALRSHLKAAQKPTSSSPDRRAPRDVLVKAEVRRHMTLRAVQQAILSATTGVTEGRVRFNLVNGWLMQKLLFRRDLERKPVSLPVFRALWPLLGQRQLLMPLVRPKGVYCFYSSALLKELARLIGDRSCVEIAAGDGTLTRFLREYGVDITATDDYSWSKAVDYPTDVLRQDARTALRTHRPQVVLCSWPPTDNDFERHVFTTPSVELYVVLSSTAEISAGAWVDYRKQDTFKLNTDARLSRLLLPPETSPAVHVFRRRRTVKDPT